MNKADMFIMLNKADDAHDRKAEYLRLQTVLLIEVLDRMGREASTPPPEPPLPKVSKAVKAKK